MKLTLRGENAREKIMVVFRIKSDWLRKCRDIFLTNHESQKIPNNPKSIINNNNNLIFILRKIHVNMIKCALHESTIDTSLKTNQNSALSLTRKLKKKKKKRNTLSQLRLHLFHVEKVLESWYEFQIRSWCHVVVPLELVKEGFGQVSCSSVESLAHLNTALLNLRLHF